MIQVVLLSPKSIEDQKKGLHRESKDIYPLIGLRPKKRVFTAIWHYVRPELVGFICVYRHFLVRSSSAEISMGGR